ncbi:LysR family transcriptional regulator substrate-binding protein [Corynebacterium gerontici]|uniref:LysR substrate binding domain protein n=1 Tax=Corynebacterium gerontici TaxID=2079234 RepID=A0A3G6J4Z5_9CORY|nr:LysR family transcriptional regulator substrate-binding protein [Corynebacterium gerontici]AZA11114.1 LysR substrate binding domain protein [Corynebacterium gerontici]
MLSLSFVTGTEPDKWFQRFQDRTLHGGLQAHGSDDPVQELFDATVDLALVRLPDARVERALEEYHLVRLYEEAPGVALPKDHTLTLMEEIPAEELVDETVMATYQGPEHVQEIRDGLQVVAANVGVVFAPRPMLKVLCGKKVEHRGLLGNPGDATTIALLWRKERDADDIQDFVGIAKGRTMNSSRQQKTKKPRTVKRNSDRVPNKKSQRNRQQRGRGRRR